MVVSVVVAFAFAKAVCSTWFIFSDTSIIFPDGEMGQVRILR